MVEDVCDLEALDNYLSSDSSPDRCMLLSDLDGFLTGVLCSPELIMPGEWLTVAFGTEQIDVPPNILELVMARYNQIVAGLNATPRVIEPIFWQAKEGHVIAMDWCEGFMDAVALRKEAWDTFRRTKRARDWMYPIVAHTFDDKGVSLVGANEQQLDALLDASAKKIPETVPKIYAYWQNKRKPARAKSAF